jgi:hypothetical protein
LVETNPPHKDSFHQIGEFIVSKMAFVQEEQSGRKEFTEGRGKKSPTVMECRNKELRKWDIYKEWRRKEKYDREEKENNK